MYVYTFVDQMPKFKGGDREMIKFLGGNFRYSEIDDSEYQSTFHALFVVDKDGGIIGVRIINKKQEDWSKPEIALVEMLQNMPAWNPGLCFGKPVPVMYPFIFRTDPNIFP